MSSFASLPLFSSLFQCLLAGPVSAGEHLVRELLLLILPHLLGLLRPVGQFVIWEIYCRLGSVLSAEQLIAADIEVSLSLYCRTSSVIRWDFMNLQS